MKNHHHHKEPKRVSIGILTVSSTRTENDDETAAWMKKLIKSEDHILHSYKIVKDDKNMISSTVIEMTNSIDDLQVLLISGGTGITHDDVTIESVRPLFDKELTAFGAIFAQLSYEKIGPAAILSRATSGVIKNTLIFCFPGSMNAVKMACMEIIFPDLSHFVGHIIHEQENNEQTNAQNNAQTITTIENSYEIIS